MKKILSNFLDYLFMVLLQRELRRMDQWDRFKIEVDGFMFYVDFCMKGDSYNYEEIKPISFKRIWKRKRR